MDPILCDRPTVNPCIIINQQTSFTDLEDSVSSQLDSQREDREASRPSQGTEEVDDPFLAGSKHRAKKRRRSHDPAAGVKLVTDTLREKWEEDKEQYEAARQDEKKVYEEEKDRRERILNVMEKNQEAMTAIADAIKMLVTNSK